MVRETWRFHMYIHPLSTACNQLDTNDLKCAIKIHVYPIGLSVNHRQVSNGQIINHGVLDAYMKHETVSIYSYHDWGP